MAKVQLPFHHHLEYCLASEEQREKQSPGATTASEVSPAIFRVAATADSYELHSLRAVPASCGQVAACDWCHWAALCHREVFGKEFMQQFASCFWVQNLPCTSVVA